MRQKSRTSRLALRRIVDIYVDTRTGRFIETLDCGQTDIPLRGNVRLSGRPNARQFESGHELSLFPLRTWRRRRDMMKINELPPISADEVARFLAISSRSVRRLVDRGALRPTRIGGFTAFRWPDVLRCAGIEPDVTTRDTLTPLVTPQQAAERLGCAPEIVRAAIARGDLPPVRIGSLVRLRFDDVVRFNTTAGPHAPRE